MSRESQRYVRSRAVLFRRCGREVLLALPDQPDFRSLSETAGDVWGLLEQPRTTRELAEVLADRYGETPEAVALGVDDLIEELARLQAIVVVSDR